MTLHGLAPVVRLALGFAAGLLVFGVLLGPYTSLVRLALDRTASAWEPPGIVLDSITSHGERLTVSYSRREGAPAPPPGIVRMPEAFFRLEAGSVFWDFLILVALFAGFAAGKPARVAAGLGAALAALFLLHVASIGLVIRTGYRPEANRFDLGLATNPWLRQAVPVALWALLCPLRRRAALPCPPDDQA